MHPLSVGRLVALAALVLTVHLTAAPLPLSGRDAPPVVVAASASEVDRFAAAELARYLGRITGQTPPVLEIEGEPPARALLVGRAFEHDFSGRLYNPAASSDDHTVLLRTGDRILLSGIGPRGALDAVYVFLEHLGCRWYAPNFAYYGAAGGECIPHTPDAAVYDLNLHEHAAFRWRKKYIEEGRSHDIPSLKALIDWMGKMRLNVLDCPINYQGQGHTEWDNWREALIPELRKRGILIEVGGHGYQNYLPASRYFADHPEWFGMYQGKRSSELREVFSTANPEAMRTFLANIRAYLRGHPEIDLFDCWPPDGARWSDAPEDVALGTPSERQILLLNQVSAMLRKEFPHTGLQFIAYASYVEPPSVHRPAPGVQMEFCPINRSFDAPLYDTTQPDNAPYHHALTGWINGVMDPDSVTLYTYISKYAWHSLPILVPHLIADEARHLQELGLGGFSSYSEPAGWASLELDHYFLARYSWTVLPTPDSELQGYARHRFGPAVTPVLAYLRLVEQTIPFAAGIPGNHLKLESERAYQAKFRAAKPLLEEATRLAAGTPFAILVAQLEGSRRYAENELSLRVAYLEEGPKSHSPRITALLAAREALNPTLFQEGLIGPSHR